MGETRVFSSLLGKFMVIALPPELERLVQRQVESGKYETAIEALLAGMNLLDQQNESELDPEQLAILRREVKIGIDAIARGEVVDGPTAMEALRQRNHQRYSGS